MCDYQGYEFGAGWYPDSVCIDGKLYDADLCDEEGNLYDNGLDAVCPICDKEGAINWWYSRYEDSCPSDETPVTEKDWAEINAYHMAGAMNLVADIRKNRGADEPDIEQDE